MKVSYALNHHWYETSLLHQAVLSYVMSRYFIVKKSVYLRDRFCILTKMKKSVWHCFIPEFFLCLHHNFYYFALLQHVAHECMSHMYVTMTSGLLSGSSWSTNVTHFQLWIWHPFRHENLWGYQDNFIYKKACCYIKDSQNLEVFRIIMVHYRLYTLY